MCTGETTIFRFNRNGRPNNTECLTTRNPTVVPSRIEIKVVFLYVS